jgi:hypothetical protein
MMGRLKHNQGQFFYSFRLKDEKMLFLAIIQYARLLMFSTCRGCTWSWHRSPNVGRSSIESGTHDPDAELFDLMGELQLYGMKAAYDEIMATAVKRQHEPQRIIGDLLTAEINEKQARSIKYQLSIAKLPLAKDIDDFQFDGTPIDETLVWISPAADSLPSSATPY